MSETDKIMQGYKEALETAKKFTPRASMVVLIIVL